ncbi:hypothetical protein EJ08DRAFT_415461 [Tothia fuscella]|uniref:tRNA-splicing endonuclease subunit Sen15 domain-containing protein n=1 Tax=Tothia fuscella TaxID=1048955 RepID=A0A9P4NKC9_9PEZI|nr:hypothetical protein EJ08DRAFT_415461 [Tothia fuscella]
MAAATNEYVAFEASALTNYIQENTPINPIHEEHYHELALQILHNLEHQHRWTNLTIHTHSPVAQKPLPRPLISGLPTKRFYIHPDEQIALLEAESAQNKAAEAIGTAPEAVAALVPEREWVLPHHRMEKWTLRKLAEIMDSVTLVPPAMTVDEKARKEVKNKWRTTKRVLLATLQDDSTVVYYIIHDGVVKPRQN